MEYCGWETCLGWGNSGHLCFGRCHHDPASDEEDETFLNVMRRFWTSAAQEFVRPELRRICLRWDVRETPHSVMATCRSMHHTNKQTCEHTTVTHSLRGQKVMCWPVLSVSCKGFMPKAKISLTYRKVFGHMYRTKNCLTFALLFTLLTAHWLQMSAAWLKSKVILFAQLISANDYQKVDKNKQSLTGILFCHW